MDYQVAKVIGHRGACGHAPENTLISMSKAHELGATWVEFDVMLSKCGEPVIIHDWTLERTTTGTGHVAETSLAELATLDCGVWYGESFVGQKIPTLKILLDHLSPLNMGINVELKPSPGFERLTTLKTLEVLHSSWPASAIKPLVSSFSTIALETAFESNKDTHLGLIIDTWEGDWQESLDQYHCISLHVDHNILTPESVRKIKDTGRLVLAYTVNDVETANKLFDWGVDSVFTDFPDVILAGLIESNRL